MQIANFKAKAAPSSDPSNDNNLKKIEVKHSKSTPTILARDLKIEGIISSSGLIEIEGVIKGTITGNSVILREEGSIEGEITADSLSLRGTFQGKIKAKSINVSSKATVTGDVEYETLSVEDGACVDGQFKKIKAS